MPDTYTPDNERDAAVLHASTTPAEAFSTALNRATDEVADIATHNGSAVSDALNLVVNLTDAYSAHPEWAQDEAIENAYEEQPYTVRSWV